MIEALRLPDGTRAGLPLDEQVSTTTSHNAEQDGGEHEIEDALRHKLIFSADVELVPPGTLPRYEMKARLVHKAYRE